MKWIQCAHTAPCGIAADRALAAEGGVKGSPVSYEASAICTFEDELYFSHRRQNPTGRFAGVVSL